MQKVLSIFSETLQPQFNEGWKAWQDYVESGWKNKKKNPYKKNTSEWYSWNKGRNLNDKGLSDLNP